MATRTVRNAVTGNLPDVLITGLAPTTTLVTATFGEAAPEAAQFVDSPYVDYDATVAQLETLATDRGFTRDPDWLKAALQDAHRGYDTSRANGDTVVEAQAAAEADGDASQAAPDAAAGQ